MNTVLLILTFNGFQSGGITTIDFTHPSGMDACHMVGQKWLNKVSENEKQEDSFYICINKYKGMYDVK